MRLGVNFAYTGIDPVKAVDTAQRAESLGYDSVWTAEAYGSDAVVPLAWIAAQHRARSSSAPASCRCRPAPRP